jgi:Flp pilus assembly protein TadG
MLMRRRRQDEAGAIAVIFALLVTLMFVMAALTVDLGNAFMEKRERQKDTDLATLAGAGISGANLPATSAALCADATYAGPRANPADGGVTESATYLARQIGGTATAYAAAWTDCSATNGEIVYGLPKRNSAGKWEATFNKNQLSLISPPKHVEYGFAKVIGTSGNDVQGVSTVEIKSPKFSTLPFYAYSGCDYGPQTLQQPNNGQSSDLIRLAFPDDPNPANSNVAELTSVTPNFYPAGTATGTMQPITLAGTNLTGVTEVGFFESGNAVDGPPPVTTTAFTITNANEIKVPDLPDQARGVTGVQQFWYIRVKKATGQWSAVYTGTNGNPVLNAPRLTIGTPPLLCGQGSSSGNFGTLLLSHSGFSGWDSVGAANVALGLTNSLAVYPPGGPADGTCSSAQTTTVLWTADGTNCVDTDTGMSANVASGGFLGLGSSAVGGNQYLMYPNGKTKCANGGTQEATTIIATRTVNDDTLTCFFNSPSTHISEVIDPAYAGAPLISSDIYGSPRFGYVPILKIQPSNGGSEKYQIIDFRACFITDQPPSSVKGDGPSTATNGFVMDNNGVKSVQVIFLNGNALPNPPVKNGVINYIGSGPKIPILVN